MECRLSSLSASARALALLRLHTITDWILKGDFHASAIRDGEPCRSSLYREDVIFDARRISHRLLFTHALYTRARFILPRFVARNYCTRQANIRPGLTVAVCSHPQCTRTNWALIPVGWELIFKKCWSCSLSLHVRERKRDVC